MFHPDTASLRHVETTAAAVASKFCYHEIRTPIIEPTTLINRTLGETSDIVRKEMFNFDDHGVATVLRPEATASVCRALIQRGIRHVDAIHNAIRLYYCGPMFRRERPQAGRYRQFSQFGVEVVGGDGGVASDVEVICLAQQILLELGLTSTDITLHINSLGDRQSRELFNEKLKRFFLLRISVLSTDSVARVNRGAALRVLDSKDARDQRLLHGSLSKEERQVLANDIQHNLNCSDDEAKMMAAMPAPSISEVMNDSSRQRFNDVLELLRKLDIPFVVNPLLVRGLDYYCHTTFEYMTINGAAAATVGSHGSTVLAGGRYDSLMRQLGGADLPAVGWAAGVERLALAREAAANVSTLVEPRSIAVVTATEVQDTAATSAGTIGDDAAELSLYAMKLSMRLRAVGLHVLSTTSGNLSKQLKIADKRNAAVAVIIGSREMSNGTVLVKSLQSSQQVEVPSADIALLCERIKAFGR